MLRRRLVFSAPFVLVACRHAPPADPAEHDDRESEWQVGKASPPPIDAAVPGAAETAPVDAPVVTVIDAPPRRDPAEACRSTPERPHPCTVNPPPPRRDPPPTGNPPGPLFGRVVSTQVDATDLVVTFSVPVEPHQDWADHWRAEIVDGAGRPIRDGSISIRDCRPRYCRGTVRLTHDQIARYGRVRITER